MGFINFTNSTYKIENVKIQKTSEEKHEVVRVKFSGYQHVDLYSLPYHHQASQKWATSSNAPESERPKGAEKKGGRFLTSLQGD